ncbi:MAG: hypothetical protein OXI66_03750 [Boseongicola sp.]|nr:hypothetical protein [Boseongicola sp.]MDE0344887.1 hypothetical protein [Boseongicola sp.]MXW86318.1 hypothetical protein [Boseongicola sp. SB0667_bin_21]MYI68408.1 hypothetical protein [Boseongicola sp. SB0673_bin_14]
MSRSKRTLRVTAEDALARGKVFSVMAQRDWELLHEIARYIRDDVDPALALTDPSRYRLLREAVTRCHVQGLTHMTPERIRAVTGWAPDVHQPASSGGRKPETAEEPEGVSLP